MQDPTPAELVPSRTRWRNAALVVAAVLALVLAGASSPVLRPSVFDANWDKSLAVSPGDRTIVAILDGKPRVWPSATITGVVAPRGTHVVGAWVMDAQRARAELAERPGKGPAETQDTTWRDVIDFPRIGSKTALPRRVHNGREVMLAVVWQIDDCGAVTGRGQSGADVRDTGYENVPFIRWRTALGTAHTSEAAKDLGPTSRDAVDLLRSAGVCP